LGNTVLHAHRAQGQPRIHVAVEGDAADRAAVPAAGRALLLFDEADRPQFRRAGHGNSPGMRQKAVERVEFGCELTLDMIDGVNEPRIHLDLAPADDAHAPRHADARLVVAIDIGAHRQFALVLFGVEQFADPLGIFERIAAARDRAADRAGLDTPAFDADIHLRRSGNQELALAKVDQRAIRRRVRLTQAVENRARRIRAARREQLAADDLEQIAADEGFLRLSDEAGIFARAVIAVRRQRLGGVRAIGRRRGGARQAARRLARHLEFIAMHSRMLAHMIDDQDLVRQIEDEIALILGARQSKAHRLELEDEVVAERAIEAEMLVLGTPEQIVERAQHREDARLPAALLLREARVALAHLARDMVLADITELYCREAAQRLGDIRDQNPAAAIERLDREAAVPRGEYKRRIDKAHIEPRIAAGKLEARGQENAAPVVKRMRQRVVLALIGADPGLALDANAAAGRIAGALHWDPSR